jgi:NAD(P)-dependent dehydrogenase (short-subunit alcohol dehydrogenase family)
MFGPDRVLTAANFDFKGKSYLITGASGGIGLKTIQKLLESGATIYSNSRRAIGIEHPNLKHTTGDITNEEFVKSWIVSIDKIDGLVYSAGMIEPRPIRFETKEKMMKVWDVNYFAAVNLVSNLIKKKKINTWSSSVFISSISARAPYIGGSKYTGSKAALEVFAKVMAMELVEKKARTNCLAPAMVKTEMYEKGMDTGSEERMAEHISKYPFGIGEPEDVAQACCFLLSDASRWINGVTLTMDGGYLLT